jgi:hypothetical protein
LARQDLDVADALAILGREDVRWHDLYHVFELIEGDVGGISSVTAGRPRRPWSVSGGPPTAAVRSAEWRGMPRTASRRRTGR